MNDTYYVIEKRFKGFFGKKPDGHYSYVVITDDKTDDGMILEFIGISKIDGKKLSIFTTMGWSGYNADELITQFPNKNYMIIEKLKSNVKEIVNKNIDYTSIKKMESSTKITINFKETGKYFKTKNNTFILYKVDNGWYIFVSDMILNVEADDFSESSINMNVKKSVAMTQSMFNNTGLSKLNFKMRD